MNKIPFVGVIVTLFLISCTDFDPETNLNGSFSDIRTMLSENPPTEIFDVMSDNFEIVTKNNTIIKVPPGSFFDSEGSPYVGLINFQVTELFKKSEILKYGFHTKTLDGQILESDGEFNFYATDESGNRLMLKEQSLELSVLNEEPNREATLFDLGEGSWFVADSSNLRVAEWLNAENEWVIGYVAAIPELQWVNIDYFSKFPTELTEVNIELPEGYSSQNSQIWVIHTERDIVINVFSPSNKFIINLPLDEEFDIIAIAAQEEDIFRMDECTHVIEAGIRVNLDPKEKSQEDIIAFLETMD